MPIFLAPLYLAAAGLAALPVIMHLLHRRKPRPVPFSTIRFLRTAVARTRRSRHVTNIFVLLLRVLILLLLALAFSRPKLQSAKWLPQGRRTVLMILDSSASMHFQQGEKSSFLLAQEWALSLLRSLDSGDRVGLLAPGSKEDTAAFPPISDHRAVQTVLAELKAGFTDLDLVTVMQDALTRLNYGEGLTGLEIHVFSDFQATGWNRTAAENLSRQLAGKDVAVFLNRLQPERIGNASLKKVDFAPPVLIGDDGYILHAEIVASPDFGPDNSLSLEVNGQELMTESFAFDQQNASIVEILGKATGQGEYVKGTLRLPSDSFAPDNTYHFILPRATGVPVLLVEGGTTTTTTTSDGLRDTLFLRHLLAPRTQRSTIFMPETMTWNAFLAADLARYELVMLSNPPALTGMVATHLENFIRNGGVAIVFPGTGTSLEARGPDIEMLSHLQIRRQTFAEPTIITVVPHAPASQLEQRVLNMLHGPVDIPVRQRVLFEAGGKKTELESLFMYTDQSPFMLRGTLGNGHLYLASLSANRDWSEWPLSPFFVVLIHELAQDAAVRQHSTAPMTTVGEGLPLPWPLEVRNQEFRVTDPQGRERLLNAQRQSLAEPFLLDGFNTPGFHRITGADREIWAAVNVAAKERTLAFIGPGKLADDFRAANLYQAANWLEQREQLVNLQQGRPLWPLLLSVAFVLLLVEELFANVQSRVRELPAGLRQLLAGDEA